MTSNRLLALGLFRTICGRTAVHGHSAWVSRHRGRNSGQHGRAVLARVHALRCPPDRCSGAFGGLDQSCARRAERSVGDGGRVLCRGLVLRVWRHKGVSGE
jgi:hypothetical protein